MRPRVPVERPRHELSEDDAEERWLAATHLRLANGPQLSRRALEVCADHFPACASCPLRGPCEAATHTADSFLGQAVDHMNRAAAKLALAAPAEDDE